MFCSCYDHQTKEETGSGSKNRCAVPDFIRDPEGFDYRCKHQCCSKSRLLCSVFAFDMSCDRKTIRAGFSFNAFALQRCPAVSGSNQAYRAISTSQLNALPHLHLWPIDVVVFHGSQGRPCFEGGFPLRCLQRLSCPNIATQHYRWHDNWSTSGSFTPVLSY